MAKNAKKLTQAEIDYVILRNNLKLAQKELADKRAAKRAEKLASKADKDAAKAAKSEARVAAKAEKIAARAAKADAKAAKLAEKTAKAQARFDKVQARLAALTAKQFKPQNIRKANRKASKVTVLVSNGVEQKAA